MLRRRSLKSVHRFKIQTSARFAPPSAQKKFPSVLRLQIRTGETSARAAPRRTPMTAKISPTSIWFFIVMHFNRRLLWRASRLKTRIWNFCVIPMSKTTRDSVQMCVTRGSISCVMAFMIRLSSRREHLFERLTLPGGRSPVQWPMPLLVHRAYPCPSIKRSASRAAWHPRPAEVMAWRNLLSSTSPAAKIPGTFVDVLPGLQSA